MKLITKEWKETLFPNAFNVKVGKNIFIVHIMCVTMYVDIKPSLS